MTGSLPPSFVPKERRERPKLTSDRTAKSEPESEHRPVSATAEPAPPQRIARLHPDPNDPSRVRPAASEVVSETPKTPVGGVTKPPPAFAPQNRRQPNAKAPVSSSPAIPRPPAGNSQRVRPPGDTSTRDRQRPKRRRRNGKKFTAILLVAVLLSVIVWPIWLVSHVDKSMNRVDALVGGANTPGTTYLFAGSDSREGWNPDDPTEGQRSDSLVLVHKAANGQTAMVSLPRDTYVDVPGVGWTKLNAAFSLGGPQLAVETVQQITGLTVDHYVQIGMAGVGEIVDALGGVELCWDQDVSDEFSGMEWVSGCHNVNGTEALAFSRMRYADPLGDVGRTMRQRQLLGAVSDKALSWRTLINPAEQLKLGNSAAEALTVGRNTKIWNVGFLLLAMRSASAAGLSGAPPISDYNAMVDAGSVMLLDETLAPVFFQKLADGTLTPEDFDQPG